MAIFGKTVLDLYKEIALCPPEVFPPYNVSMQPPTGAPQLHFCTIAQVAGLNPDFSMQDELVRVVQTEIQEHKAQLDAAFM